MIKPIMQLIFEYALAPIHHLQPISVYSVLESVFLAFILIIAPIAFIVLLASPLILLIVFWILQHKKYSNSEYAQATNTPLIQVWNDTGKRGEYLLFQIADKSFDGEKHWLFNVYIPTSNGKTTEVDAILLHSSGIYVFESKNYGGWIYGSENQEYWTQCFKSSRYAPTQKYKFYNPLKQNQLHINSYVAYLQQDPNEIPIHSIIVFGNHAIFRNVELSSNKHILTSLSDLPSVLSQIIDNSPQVNKEILDIIYAKTVPLSNVSDEVKSKHIASIYPHIPPSPESSIKASRTNNLSRAILCPKCGGKLILRTAKKGANQGNTFLGCSNFPKCHYIKNLNQ